MNITIRVKKQIVKNLFDSLRACQANFRYSHNHYQFDILNIERWWMNDSIGEQSGITFKVLDNVISNTIYIHKDNIESFEVTNEIKINE